MGLDWKRYCQDRELCVEGDDVEVKLAHGRQHWVNVVEHDGAIHLRAIVGNRRALQLIEDAAVRAWQRNREMQLVGFRIDDRGRLVGETWVPKVGLDREEFVMCVKTVALESDRLEFLLTGKDAE
jgi:hypothetical protein